MSSQKPRMFWQAVERASDGQCRYCCVLAERLPPGYQLPTLSGRDICDINHRTLVTAQRHAVQMQQYFDDLARCRPQPDVDQPQLTYAELDAVLSAATQVDAGEEIECIEGDDQDRLCAALGSAIPKLRLLLRAARR